ncbi:MAG TPA: CHAT domain-containing tetratricopeptide repeat protein [Terriglobales bacterium]
MLAISSACNRSDQKPQLEHAQQTFIHGNLPASQVEAERGYQYFRTSNPPLAWQFRVLEAEALTWRGLSQQVLGVLDTVPSPVRPLLNIPILTLQSVAHARLHDFTAAEQALKRADDACMKSADASCGAVLRAHGVLAMERAQYAEAKSYFEQTLAVAQSDPFLKSTALLNLGAASLQQAHFDEAIDWSQSALNLATTLGARDIMQVALGNLGWAYYRLGDPEKALDEFERATQAATELGDDLYQLRWRTTAGYVYLDDHNYQRAEQAYTQALTLAQKISSKEDIFNALISLALVSEQTGELDEADKYAERGISMARADANRADEFYPLMVKGRVAAKQHDDGRAEGVFREIASDPKSDVSLKWEAQHALAKLYEGENRPSHAEREYCAALKTFETARSELKHEESTLPFLTNASRIYDDYVHFLVTRGRSAEALQVADFTRARTLAEGLGQLGRGVSLTPSALDAQAVARRARGSVLFYWLGERQSYLWAINARKTVLFTLPAESEIKAAVERYQKALVGPQDVLETSNRDGAWLYTTLVAPAASLLGKNGKVLIIADGSLNGLNFETLLAQGERLHYWIEDATISDASSLRLLHAPAATRTSNGKLLMIGNPLAAGSEYGALPNAGLEMDKIENHFADGERTVYAQAEATAASYLGSKPGQFSYIHFVAHGTASRTSPLDSAVVLSPSGKQEDSFKLYARDVIGCPLHARLVTISTCYGAGTRAYTGEGLVGLSWAFLRAGAHNVVGALWEVNDASTPQLMDRFYAELTRGRDPNVALRSAKLSLLHSKNAFRRPYYWAPFQMYSGM